MNLTEKRIIVLFLTFLCVLIVSLTGYWTLNKEQIILAVKGEEIKISTFKTTVKDLLDEKQITYDEDDKVIPSLDTEVKDYMEIKVVEVTKDQQVELEQIPYEVKLVEDPNLLKGKTEVEQEGSEGKKELVYDLTYEDGVLVEKNLAKEVINLDPKDKVVKKGIKEEYIVASRGETSRELNAYSATGGKHMSVVATAYAGDGITSTGTVPRWGTIAVDPRVIPYGTRVYIPQFGMTFVAEDCGGAIKGNKIDIFMGSEGEAYSWGRRTIDVYVGK